jgi:AraC-like DNA-binding protein
MPYRVEFIGITDVTKEKSQYYKKELVLDNTSSRRATVRIPEIPDSPTIYFLHPRRENASLKVAIAPAYPKEKVITQPENVVDMLALRTEIPANTDVTLLPPGNKDLFLLINVVHWADDKYRATKIIPEKDLYHFTASWYLTPEEVKQKAINLQEQITNEHISRKLIHSSAEDITTLYTQYGSIKKLAKEYFSLPKLTVMKYIHNKEITLPRGRRGKRLPSAEEVIEKYNQGMTLSQIARKAGVKRKRISELFKANGGQFRKRKKY